MDLSFPFCFGRPALIPVVRVQSYVSHRLDGHLTGVPPLLSLWFILAQTLATWDLTTLRMASVLVAAFIAVMGRATVRLNMLALMMTSRRTLRMKSLCPS